MRLGDGHELDSGSCTLKRSAVFPVYVLSLIIVLSAFMPAFTEIPFENPGLLLLLNAVFLSGASSLVAVLALAGYLRSSRVELLLAGCGVLSSGLGAFIAGLIAGGDRSPNDFITVHNLGVLLAAVMHLAASLKAAQHTPTLAPASLHKALGAYGAIAVALLLCLAGERAGGIPEFFVPGEGSTRLRVLFLTGTIALMGTAAILLWVDARRLNGVSLRFYSLGLGMTAFGLMGVFLGVPGSVLSWVGRAAQYAGNLYLLAAVLIFIGRVRRQKLDVSLAVAEFFNESADHYRTLVETMKGAVVSVDAAGKVFLWNRAAEQMFGYSADEAAGRELTDLVAPSEGRRALLAAIDSGGHGPFEMPLRRKDGGAVVGEISVVSAGRGKSAIIRDVTERTLAEDALRRAYEHRRLTLESAEMGAWDYHLETGEVFWDQRCRQMWGVPECDQINYDVAIERIHPEDRTVVDAAVKRAIEGVDDGAYHQEFRVVWPDGITRWVSSHGRVFFRVEGGRRQAVRFSGANQDITRRKEIEAAAMEARRQKDAATERSLERLGLLSWTAAGLLYANDPRGLVSSLCGGVMTHLQCDMFFNYLLDEQTGHLRLNACDGVTPFEKTLEQLNFGAGPCTCVRDGKRVIPEHVGVSSDPCLEVVAPLGIKAFACHPLLGTGGKVIGTLAFGSRGRESFAEEDVLLMQALSDQVATALVRVRDERALQQANESLEQRVTERTDMLERTINVLHREIEERRRTAGELSAANRQLEARAGQLRALAGELTMAEHRERHRTGKVLHDHLQQLLSSAKMQVSCLKSEPEVRLESVTRIENLMGEAIQVTRSLTGELSPPILQVSGLKAGLEWLAGRTTERLGLEVIVEAADDPQLPEAMKIMLFEAVRELLFNCAKHSGVRRAEIHIAREDSTLSVTVSDQGAGFDPVKLGTPGAMGIGFGLFSIRERLQLVGGAFEIESAPKAGSRFHMRVPLGGDGASGDRQSPSDPVPQRIRVLLVDDHAIMREGLAVMLSKEPDIQVVGEAQDGWQALELAHRLAPDVVLMDISMPGLNGIEATRIICRELPDIRVLGLSMLYEEGERAEAIREAGAVGYVAKGSPSSDLLAALRGCINRSAEGPASRASAQALPSHAAPRPA